MEKYIYRVVNIVGKIDFNGIDNDELVYGLLEIADKENAEIIEKYRPTKRKNPDGRAFPAISIRWGNPPYTTVIFKRRWGGKTNIICTGLKTEEELRRVDEDLKSKLSNHFPSKNIETKASVVNFVVSGYLNRRVDLEKINEIAPDFFYDPEQFPGGIFKLNNLTILLFSNGKFVCPTPRIEYMEEVIKRLYHGLEENNILF
ncbi:MAG: hypothetical protein QXX38_01450 [Candidatus Aenigmatarchaeota archaeon]